MKWCTHRSCTYIGIYHRHVSAFCVRFIAFSGIHQLQLDLNLLQASTDVQAQMSLSHLQELRRLRIFSEEMAQERGLADVITGASSTTLLLAVT
jgi:hypothetical protein